MSVNLKSLVAKLNDTTRAALEAAAGLCLSRTNYDVEIEHFLMKLLDSTNGDLGPIMKRFEVDRSRFAAELTRSLDKLKSGNARTPALSPYLLKMFTEAWTLGSINFGAGEIRSGFAILALAATEDLARLMRDVSREFQKIDAEALRKDFQQIVSGTAEDYISSLAAEPSTGAPRAAGDGKTPHLDQYTVDLTENARQGKIDPVVARDFEIRQVVDILTRRRQNNPILVGEAGVGKTAVVEGFALRVVKGDVPPPLRNIKLCSLDLALLQAGAGVKGEFENRLKALINEVKSSPTPIVMFIDEAHTMIGAGGTAGQNDAANLLKPALARGELRTIAATTWSEYKKFFEKDPALTRRFQPVKVEEPTEAQAVMMLRGVVSALETHHNVRILDEAVSAAVRLSHRYLADRQLPDKAVSVLDTACARLSLSQNSVPPAVEDVVRELEDLNVQIRVLEREAAVGGDFGERLAQLASSKTKTEQRLSDLNARWDQERQLVSQIRDVRLKLEEIANNPPAGVASGAQAVQPALDIAPLRLQLDQLNEQLAALQKEKPLIRVCVDSLIVSDVLSGWTGIPTGKMLRNEISMVLEMEAHLGRRVVGQTHAMDLISQRIRTSRAGMDDPVKPVGVFMLIGPSGVGKTETALALSDLLYGGEKNLITINMSEFQEPHTVSTLKGSPPGYVGYGEGGVLTEAVRRRPYSVVLLDEVEKAHPDVLELFYQVFDKGVMEDGEGRQIDFKNTVIILTTNACTDALMKLCADPETMPDASGLVQAIKPELNKVFQPAFLGRMVIIPYFPLRDDVMKEIVRLKLGKIQRRLQETHRISLTCDADLINEVVKRCTEVESGARNVDNILSNTMLPEISRQLLTRIAEGEALKPIHVSVGPDGGFLYS